MRKELPAKDEGLIVCGEQDELTTGDDKKYVGSGISMHQERFTKDKAPVVQGKLDELKIGNKTGTWGPTR